MLSTLAQWLVIGLVIGVALRLIRHLGWGTALLAGIGTAFIAFFALTLFVAYTL